MQITFVHQVTTHIGTHPSLKQHVIRQHNRSAATWLEVAIYML